ncbi:hypothetical protein [Anoxybacteroides amylolyticum]|uniref:Uncharacterized protein n=1 Tax=Anoxybacteroides amylolyticum TaxID=294699 RepID=A0A167THL4_9BACL|nr:hypothetical protein [Anoxybacillus amylolyticus]ANB60794.1 hypothetical protein GFC30_2290 [Anoxybacillus amylolyticus]
MFPHLKDFEQDSENLQIQIYGQRIYRSQTLYEYLLEFLLVFISPKGESDSVDSADQGFSFFVPKNSTLKYFPNPRIGLKRFIFLNKSDPEKRFGVDKDALSSFRAYLQENIEIDNSNLNSDMVLDIIQDLLYSFNAVTGGRSWFAQSLLPVAPELIFCEAMGKKAVRKSMEYERNDKKVDKAFSFTDRAFMARGGEVYYLHVLQGILQKPEYEERLVEGLRSLVQGIPQLSEVANYIQKMWFLYHYEDNSIDSDGIMWIKKEVSWIPDNYSLRAGYTVIELDNLLRSKLDPFEKIELLGSLIVIQIIRMMCLQSTKLLYNDDNQEWLIDLTDDPSGSIRKMAVSSYRKLEENVFRVVHEANLKKYQEKLRSQNKKSSEMHIYKEASEDTNKLVRRLGKDIEFVVPPTGKNMRLTLNENMIKLLVTSLIIPGERILFSTFLNKCYEHFRMVIGPIEALKHFGEKQNLDLSSFDENVNIMQQMLKDCGFLRDLSDAVSIVENPFV